MQPNKPCEGRPIMQNYSRCSVAGAADQNPFCLYNLPPFQGLIFFLSITRDCAPRCGASSRAIAPRRLQREKGKK
jgi:hypothetical protein